jgi:hypothetical protein
MGRRSAVLVSGEAGMGKTSLIRAVFDTASECSTLVGWGTCWQGEGAPGFWPWMQALDDLTRAIGRDAAIAAGGYDRDRLAALIRELGPAAETTDDPDRRRSSCSTRLFAGSRTSRLISTSRLCSMICSGRIPRLSTCWTTSLPHPWRLGC